MNNLELKVQELEAKVKQLEADKVSMYMPYTITDIIRNVVIDRKVKAGAEVISDFLIFKFKDKEYKIPFYV